MMQVDAVDFWIKRLKYLRVSHVTYPEHACMVGVPASPAHGFNSQYTPVQTAIARYYSQSSLFAMHTSLD